MGLDLDLSASFAKIDRAEEHLKSLQIEIPLAVRERPPHSLRGEIDPRTGWCSVRVRREKPKEPRLAAIVGDYVHNLRSALDYIVTALVDATPGLTLSTSHQFPIYDDPVAYRDSIWRMGERVGRGRLRGILHGLTLIEPLQPYHTQPDADADPLAQLNRLSNADKHRQILGYWPDPQPGEITLEHNGVIAEQIQRTDRQQWINDEVEVGRLRFEPPFPESVRDSRYVRGSPLLRRTLRTTYEGDRARSADT